MVRPELANNRRQIRRDSDNVLRNIQYSSYAQIERMALNDVLSNVGAATALELAPPDSSLTGALQAVLPLRVSVPNKDNSKRLDFNLLINPGSWNQGKVHSAQASYTRHGFVTQLWGHQQDSISSTGKTAAFIVDGIGLTNVARRRSASYANFLAFISAYRNNGCELLDPTLLKSALTRVIHKVNGVELYYDNQTFMGHFNNFTINEDAEKPFLFDYSFDFVISSLSDNYDEVRGHFEPIVKNTEDIEFLSLDNILIGDIDVG